MTYFSRLFTSNGVRNFDEVLCNISPLVMEEMNYALESPFTDDKIRCAVFQMHPMKAPSPDGMSPGFYHKHWGVVGPHVCNGVCNMLFLGYFLRKINYTHVMLIPKVKDATKMTHLRPISL